MAPFWALCIVLGVAALAIDIGHAQAERLRLQNAADAAALGCTKEVSHARTILKRGTSACRQVETYAKARADGADDREAMIRVVDMIVAETAADLPQAP